MRILYATDRLLSLGTCLLDTGILLVSTEPIGAVKFGRPQNSEFVEII